MNQGFKYLELRLKKHYYNQYFFFLFEHKNKSNKFDYVNSKLLIENEWILKIG